MSIFGTLSKPENSLLIVNKRKGCLVGYGHGALILKSIRKKRNNFSGLPFVGKVMSLLFNTLCSFVIAFLPRSKCLW